ncbi:MAG: hypothetical protein JXA37_10590 [Chloroflexia bacterium]|nr:hypothetical protein [Chloroflexia bacterium]
MNAQKAFLVLALVGLVGLLGACSVDASGSPGEMVTITTETTEAEVQQAIDQAIKDPLIQDFSVDFREGHILVSAARDRADGSATDTMSFRLDLGVGDQHLTASISDVQVNNFPIQEDRLASWNELIANALERGAKETPNSNLESVSISGDVITMVWTAAPRRSGGN